MSWFSRPGDAPPARRTEPATASDIKLAYRLILKRDPDPDGLAAYLQRIDSGLTVEDLIDSLLTSGERHDRLSRPPESPQPVDDSGPDRIDPRDIIARYSVEELNVASDDYYRKMQDPSAMLRKPFAFAQETPEMLENLGALFGGLHVGTAMTVLDFGAGTCWLSRLVAQLHCRVICCDPSTAALEIGRRFFAEHPPLGREVMPATFLPFDGHRLDLPDGSVDRIICFDAFHHVPNQDEVLREFGRVLRDGGIVGFSEPGRDHSRSPQSQYEMRNHRVLENDIQLEAIFALASRYGFTQLSVRLLNDLEISLEDYTAIVDPVTTDDSALQGEVWARTRATMLNRSVFFLHKGERRLDSRGHAGLAHNIQVEPTEVPASAEGAVTLAFTITNTGEAHWLNQAPEIFGLVRLGCHLYDEAGTLVSVDHFRSELPSAVAPGETIRMTVAVPVPKGRPCLLMFDLVAEGVRWFENEGSAPVAVKVS